MARAVLALVAAQLLWSGVLAVATGASWIREGWRHRGDDPHAALVHVRGAAYADAIAAIRARIPCDGTYLLVNEGPRFGWAGMIWLRYDLAPRKAQYLGWMLDGKFVEETPSLPLPVAFAAYGEIRRVAVRHFLSFSPPPFVIVCYAKDGEDRPPRVEETADFLDEYAR